MIIVIFTGDCSARAVHDDVYHCQCLYWCCCCSDFILTCDGSSNAKKYTIACVCAGVAVIVITVVFTGDGSSNTMTYTIACVYVGVAV